MIQPTSVQWFYHYCTVNVSFEQQFFIKLFEFLTVGSRAKPLQPRHSYCPGWHKVRLEEQQRDNTAAAKSKPSSCNSSWRYYPFANANNLQVYFLHDREETISVSIVKVDSFSHLVCQWKRVCFLKIFQASPWKKKFLLWVIWNVQL